MNEIVATERELRIETIEQEIIERKQTITSEFVELGTLLLEVYENQLFIERGYDNFEQWLASPEVDLSRSVGYDLVRIAKLIEVGMLPAQLVGEIGVSKMRLLLPKTEEAPEDLQEWFDKAQTLTWGDLKDEISGRETVGYSGRGMLTDLVVEMQERDELWETPVSAQVKTL